MRRVMKEGATLEEESSKGKLLSLLTYE